MGLFWKKRKTSKELTVSDGSVEVSPMKDAKAEAFADAKAATKHLNNLLEVENGFTIKIYLAAGGHHPKEGTK